eukprot:scaffold918_cov126-Cylindrotheca_fusiformis.AAC.19
MNFSSEIHGWSKGHLEDILYLFCLFAQKTPAKLSLCSVQASCIQLKDEMRYNTKAAIVFFEQSKVHLDNNMGQRFQRVLDSIRKRTRRKGRTPNRTFDFQSLPNDLQKAVAVFLPLRETLYLIQSCKSMKGDLGLSRSLCSIGRQMSSPADISVLSVEMQNNPMCLIASVVPTDSKPFHSMTFQSEWVDQGIGERKGRLFVVAQKKVVSQGRSHALPFEEGKVVCKTSVVGHTMANVTASFHVKPDEFYQVWCFVGDQYGDLVHFKNMNFHVLSFQDTVPSCPVRKYKFSYVEDKDTHVKRRIKRLLESALFKGCCN